MIRTKIAQILSATRVVLAAGTEQGVQEGMEFIIYDLSDPIKDPDTGELLGRLELHKGRVRVIHAQERIATAMTRVQKVYNPSLAELLERFTPKGRWLEAHEQLAVESTETAVKADLTVRVGDLARSVT
jgi:hypothetical protein